MDAPNPLSQDEAAAVTSGLSSTIAMGSAVPDVLRPAVRLPTVAAGILVDGRFEVVSPLGQGGMGTVYKVYDTYHKNAIRALKTIKAEYSTNRDFVERFTSEVAISLSVTHRNICRVYDFGLDRSSDPPCLFYTMELLEGETLHERLGSRGPLELTELRVLALGLIAGLEVAHLAGVIHRDLKPSNIMLVHEANSFRPVILDFGLAVMGAVSGELAREGTLAYMAPEQSSGNRVTVAADIYSLGLILYEALTGEQPNPVGTISERLESTISLPVHRGLLKKGIPREWAALILRCIRINPTERYESPASIRKEIEEWPDRARREILILAAATLSAGAGIFLSHISGLNTYHPPHSAQDAVDRAAVLLKNQTRPAFETAVKELRRAVTIDPKWGEAWADLAYAYATAGNANYIPSEIALREAKTAALSSIRCDQKSGKAYGSLGWVESLDFDDWPKAEGDLRAALRLSPNDAQIHYWLGVHLRKKGAFSAAESQDREALRLNEQDAMVWCEVAFLYWTSGRLADMDAYMRDLLVAFPNFGLTRFLNARLLKEQDKFAQALDELDFCERLQYSSVTIAVERASVFAYQGDTSKARSELSDLEHISKTRPVDSLLIAGVYTKLGDFDSAFAWLQRAYNSHDSTLLSIATSPLLVPLHGDHRFQLLLRKLHFV